MPETITLTCHACGQVNRLPAARIAAGPVCGTCGARLIAPKPAEIDADTLATSSARDGLPLLVDFWAPWCGPCRSMAPEFARAAQALTPGVRLAKIDTQQHPEVAHRFGIRGIPLLILFDRGREVARLAGARPASDIVAFVRQHAQTAA
ncbi:thioredoxin family protein [Frigidibacter oleivorans]|uniref:thioredoxin family protein n=1 Tax=Frigidibacter oleivorans TaxID=2487129 RepID=UPI000F8E4AE3|nr:thioredoxin domain-containing protein [Frigidibacter oleivorans]